MAGIAVERSRLIGAKPAHGEPCNGCGGCCLAEVCPAGKAVLGPTAVAPCPVLTRSGDRYVCGLIADPARYAPVRTAVHGHEKMARAALRLVGSGIGCDCLADDEPPDRRVYERIRRQSAADHNRARALWGV